MNSLIRLRTAVPLLRRSIEDAPRRHGHLVYRDHPTPPKKITRMATGLMATMWFWLMWRCYHEPEEITGHFPYPKPHTWTDQELGIPPDEED